MASSGVPISALILVLISMLHLPLSRKSNNTSAQKGIYANGTIRQRIQHRALFINRHIYMSRKGSPDTSRFDVQEPFLNPFTQDVVLLHLMIQRFTVDL